MGSTSDMNSTQVPNSVLITGGNRGIGLAIVKEFLKVSPRRTRIFATYRNPQTSQELISLAQEYDSLTALQFDVEDFDSYKTFGVRIQNELGDSGLDMLINNAGIHPEDGRTLRDLTPSTMLLTYKVNCVGPTLLTRELLPLLSKGSHPNPSQKAVVVQMSSHLGSISENEHFGCYSYCCSKSALNMSMILLNDDVQKEGVTIMSLHPGWIKSDMGGPRALLELSEAVPQIMHTILQLSSKDRGAFLNYANEALRW
ncbi:C-signal [Lepeophtheirus salmonis]|uniref:C-signal n=1 Tax=Lepeophtheirus salmonis TaxID=72036 RepID=UPI001AE804EB|nr:C-factor-like [Lepeophtheirus salmonis]